ncbi:MAG: helix-turn-helix transcriptional regulator [Phycisphaeraceae bacterium]|nr:helix-turn-helix transcriptional regulator [Phycisphaerae bacterium]MBX3393651.1 helix-turn-helix transcriptional regulator [Phycisphaeraceae bacterium]
MAKSRKSVSCPVETTLRVIGGRWKVLALHYMLEETRRFSELQRLLGGISPRTLTKQLRELERDGVIRRKVYAEIPPRVEYSLSPLGKSLEPVLLSMGDWGEAFAHRVPAREP